MREEFLEPEITSDVEESDEIGLRPRRLADFVGQRELKEHLAIVLEAARQRKQPIDHLLLAGPPGLGKTTLATIIARELGVNVRYTSGPAVERPGDLRLRERPRACLVDRRVRAIHHREDRIERAARMSLIFVYIRARPPSVFACVSPRMLGRGSRWPCTSPI